ncbi:MAG: type II asparaginase [Bacteroidales bacterium]
MKNLKRFSFLLLALTIGCLTVLAQKPNIHILATGGTIAGTKDTSRGGESSYNAAQISISAILDAVPQLKEIANVTGEQVAQIGSQDITDAIWLILAKRVNALLRQNNIDGVVITHGTDTMEETAFFLNLVVKSNKPVILVGAMFPSNSISADGPSNIYNAVATASTKESQGKGVLVVMNGLILDAHNVTKTNTTEAYSFQSPNTSALGKVNSGKVVYLIENLKKHTTATPFDITNLDELPKVGIIYGHSNMSKDVTTPFLSNDYQGIVYAGVGNGNIHANIFAELERARKQGILVVRSSRVAMGSTTLDAEVDDNKYQFIASLDLNPQKSRVLLMLALTQTKDWKTIQEYFKQF